VVLFGGYAGQSALDDTWVWDGVRWTQAQVAGPSARADHAMAYDSDRGVAVLFGGDPAEGGTSDLPFFNDFWEWNGTRWSMVDAGGSDASLPAPRARHPVTYDGRLRATLIFGGRLGPAAGYEYLGDTWTRSASTWVERTYATLPSARDRATLAHDTNRHVTVLFAGRGEASGDEVALDDTWELQATGWTKVDSSPSVGRMHHAMVYDESRRRVVVFGGNVDRGSDSVTLADTIEWDGSSWTTLPVIGPPARYWHAMAYDSARERIVLMGGDGGEDSLLGDTWELWTPGPDGGTGTAERGISGWPGSCAMGRSASTPAAGFPGAALLLAGLAATARRRRGPRLSPRPRAPSRAVGCR
jgi:hypothetical protein